MADGGADAGKKRKRGVSDAKLLSASAGTAKMTSEEKKRLAQYSRGDGNKSKGVVKHRLKLGIKRSEKKISSAAKAAAQAELLLPTEAGTLEPENEILKSLRVTPAPIHRTRTGHRTAQSHRYRLRVHRT